MVVEEAQRQGWRVEDTKKGIMLYAPDGKNSVLLHRTPSDWRAIHNDIARLRRYGLRWPPKTGGR